MALSAARASNSANAARAWSAAPNWKGSSSCNGCKSSPSTADREIHEQGGGRFRQSRHLVRLFGKLPQRSLQLVARHANRGNSLSNSASKPHAGGLGALPAPAHVSRRRRRPPRADAWEASFASIAT